MSIIVGVELLSSAKAPLILQCVRRGGFQPQSKCDSDLIEKHAESKMTEADSELQRALQLLDEALRAVRELNKNDFAELKAVSKPPEEVTKVLSAFCILTEGSGKYEWKHAQKRLSKHSAVLNDIFSFDPAHLERKCARNARSLLRGISTEKINKVSSAATGILKWQLAALAYNEVYVEKVLPSLSAAKANETTIAQMGPSDQSGTKLVLPYGNHVEVIGQRGMWLKSEYGWFPLFCQGICCFKWDIAWQTLSFILPDTSVIIDLQRELFGDAACLSLFSCGKEKFAPTQALRDTPVWAGNSIMCTDYAELCPRRRALKIDATEMRGISLHQLQQLLSFVRKRCDQEDVLHGWLDGRSGETINYETMNLYQLNYWVLMPATDTFTCSYVELVAEEAHSQQPLWFVSHAWSEPVSMFVQCVAEHFRLRHLGQHTAIWVCAYANNQHELGTDLVANPEKTSFFRAMQISIGVLLILDSLAIPFQRIWCCFEESVAVTDTQRAARMLLDIATLHDGRAHVITDGTTMADLASSQSWRGEGDEWRIKGLRENDFPNDLVIQAISSINIENATATQMLDKNRILNSIAKRREEELDFEAVPNHPRYDEINRLLRSIFAVAAWPQAARQQDKKRLASLATTLQADLCRKTLNLTFNYMMAFDNANLEILANALPAKLEILVLEMQFCKGLSSPGIKAFAQRLPPSLQHLSLNLADCTQILDDDLALLSSSFPSSLVRLELNLDRCLKLGHAQTSGLVMLAHNLPDTLRSLRITSRCCMLISDKQVSQFAEGLPDELEELVLDFGGCHLVSCGGIVALRRRVPASLSKLSVDNGRNQIEACVRSKQRLSRPGLIVSMPIPSKKFSGQSPKHRSRAHIAKQISRPSAQASSDRVSISRDTNKLRASSIATSPVTPTCATSSSVESKKLRRLRWKHFF